MSPSLTPAAASPSLSQSGSVILYSGKCLCVQGYKDFGLVEPPPLTACVTMVGPFLLRLQDPDW